MTENEVPWSRGKREQQVDNEEGSFCILVQPDERTTGKMCLSFGGKLFYLCKL